MLNPDIYTTTGKWIGFDRRIFNRSKTFLKLDYHSFFQRQIYRILISKIWGCAQSKDLLQLRKCILGEPFLGSPIETWYKGQLISQDLANSIIECNSMLLGFDATPRLFDRLRVAEIGAGYGRVGDVLLLSRSLQYVIFDIPPSLYLAQWYLGRRHVGKRIFEFRHFDNFEDVREEFEDADIAFCTINQIKIIPNRYFDLVINISSLHEMRVEQLRHILGEMYRISNERVYLKQYRNYVNPYDGIIISESEYFVPNDWQKKSWLPDDNDPRNFEALIIRREIFPRQIFKNSILASPSKSRPSIAIVLANYNDGRFLRTSLDAILTQTDPADEVILVDDGSSDYSHEILLAAKAAHSNVRIIFHKQNLGQHIAIQRALLEAKSDYIVWASADDLLLPNFIEFNRLVLSDYPQAGLSFSQLATFMDGEDKIVHYNRANHGVAFDLGNNIQYYSPKDLVMVLRRNYLWMSGNTVVARRSILLNMGGFERDLRWHGDWFAYYAIALRHGAVCIPQTLALMRERPATYSRLGMTNVKIQKQVLSNLIKVLRRPCNLDLLAIFRICPSLFSPFGKTMLVIGISNIKYWDLGVPLFLWYSKRVLRGWGKKCYKILRIMQIKIISVFRLTI